jgi:hypothetical protein
MGIIHTSFVTFHRLTRYIFLDNNPITAGLGIKPTFIRIVVRSEWHILRRLRP